VRYSNFIVENFIYIYVHDAKTKNMVQRYMSIFTSYISICVTVLEHL